MDTMVIRFVVLQFILRKKV